MTTPHAPYLVFATALQVEAQALLKQLPMKAFQLPGGLRCWQNDEAALVITGTGKIRSAIGTTALLHHLQKDRPLKHTLAVNFGICGATGPDAAEIGDTILAHRICDAGSGRNWFPDLLIAHDFTEGALETHDRVVKRATDTHVPFVDMEASGFFEAASILLGPSHAHCIKVVSDHLSCTRLDRKRVEADLRAAAPDALAWAQRAAALLPVKNDSLSPEAKVVIEDAVAALQVSETRGHQLRKAALAWRIRTKGNPIEIIGDLSRLDELDRQQRLKEFHALLDQFNEA